MKTTLNINDRLLQQAKVFAAKQRMTLTRLIEEGLVLRLRPTVIRPPIKPEDIPVSSYRGEFPPDVDPLSNRSLLGIKDED